MKRVVVRQARAAISFIIREGRQRRPLATIDRVGAVTPAPSGALDCGYVTAISTHHEAQPAVT